MTMTVLDKRCEDISMATRLAQGAYWLFGILTVAMMDNGCEHIDMTEYCLGSCRQPNLAFAS